MSQTKLDKKRIAFNNNKNIILNILQVLMFEERISKNTYDKLQSGIIGMSESVPFADDVLEDIASQLSETSTYALAQFNSTKHIPVRAGEWGGYFITIEKR